MAHLSEQDRAALRARERFLESAGQIAEPVPVRPEIAASWLRSMERTVDPVAPEPDFHRMGETKLSAAALPVINHYVEELGDTRTSLLFADVHGRLIGRWSHDTSLRSALSGSFVEAGFTMAEGIVGTNGVGTVLEAGRPVEVKGAEHYSDYYLDFTCVGAPIRDPLTGRIIGVIDITSRIDETSTLAMPWITHLARQIESQLLDRESHAEKALLSAYLVAARRSRNAVLAMNGDLAIGNAEATGRLSQPQQSALWVHLQQHGLPTSNVFREVALSDTEIVMVRSRAVRRDGVTVGVVVELADRPEAKTHPAVRSTPRLGSLVGRSDAWMDVISATTRWNDAAGGIVVSGESGTGKLSALRAALGRGTELSVIDCNLVAVDGSRRWLATLREALGADDEGALVLRHVHALEPPIAEAVCSILDTTDSGRRLAATVVTGGAPPFGPLVDRFAVHELRMPPLRTRLDDLPLLLDSFTRELTHVSTRWLPDSVAVLAAQAWPDNLRGLRAVVRRVLSAHPAGAIGASSLPDDLRARVHTRRTLTRLEQLERQEIIDSLASVSGNKVAAAAVLNLARSTLYRKMASLDIAPAGKRAR